MRRRAGKVARVVALGMVVVWSLFPIYWALKTSLSTNVAAQSTPVQWVARAPELHRLSGAFRCRTGKPGRRRRDQPGPSST